MNFEELCAPENGKSTILGLGHDADLAQSGLEIGSPLEVV
jgi:hypothetical protein